MSKKEQNKKEIEDNKSCKLPLNESINKNDNFIRLKDLLPKSLGMCEECD